MLLNHYLTMARYNAWMNDKIYHCAEGLSDSARKEDRGAFFGSIHGTLNHILLADLIWLQRFASADWGAPSLQSLSFDPAHAITGLDMQPYEDFDALRAERTVIDAAILKWVKSDLTEAILKQDITYRNILRKQDQTRPMATCVSHFFNHQTHHRGQVTTLLSQLGLDPGPTDMIAMPEEPE